MVIFALLGLLVVPVLGLLLTLFPPLRLLLVDLLERLVLPVIFLTFQAGADEILILFHLVGLLDS